MSGHKLNLRTARALLGTLCPLLLTASSALLPALPAGAQSTGPVTSFPTNVEVIIDGDRKVVGDRLFINRQQCLGSKASGLDAGTGPETDPLDGSADDGGADDASTADAGSTDAGMGDGGAQENTAALITKATVGDSAPIQITLTNLNQVASQATVLEYWMGMGTNTDCNTPANRTPAAANPGKPPCKKIGETRTIDARKQVINFNANELFSDPYTLGNFSNPQITEPGCDMEGVWTLYIVALANATPSAGPPGPSIGSSIFVRFEADFTPLAAVTSARGGRGETEVTVSWNMASGANNLTDYYVYVDTDAKQPTGSGACSSPLLMMGQFLPVPIPSNLDRHQTKGTSLNLDPAGLGLDYNEQAPAVVVSVDAAGNESQASNVVCVERVSTTGFWDSCNQNAGCRDDFDKCSLSLGQKGRLGLLGWSLGVLGIALWLRRRRTV